MLKTAVLDFLKEGSAQPGETVQFGWFQFKVIGNEDDLGLETLDFKEMASFTEDFSVVEDIHALQQSTLKQHNAQMSDSNALHSAILSKSYTPGAPKAFMKHDHCLSDCNSGWYVGISDDPLDIDNPDNLCCKSLYELSIHDVRFYQYWLLPVGWCILFDNDRAEVMGPNQPGA